MRNRRRKKKRRLKKKPEVPQLLGSTLVPDSGLSFWLLRSIDLCFAALIFLLPFVMGGRQAHGQFLLIILASALAGLWCAFQFVQRDCTWVFSRVELLLAAGIGLLILQITPLPMETLNQLSPQSAEALPLWQASADSGASMGLWNRISMIPAETKSGLTILVAYCVIFLVAVQRIRSQRDAEQMLKLIGISGGLMAVFGMLQYFGSNGNFLWFYEHPFSDTDDVIKGTFTNRNHFAHFLALSIGPLAWWIATSMKEREGTRNTFGRAGSMAGDASIISLVCLALVCFGLLLSLSRGGVLAALVACCVSLLAVWLTNMLSGRIALGIFGIAVLLICGLMIYGEQQVQQRVDQLVSGDIEQLDESGGRRVIWNAVWRGINDYGLVGTGVGSHREVYPMYLVDVPKHNQHEFTHAENGYLQVCLETGGVGLGLTLLGFIIALSWCLFGMIQSPNSEVMLMMAAGMAVLLANLTHSATDFVWYCPACVVIVILVAACMCRTKHMIRGSRGGSSGVWRMPRPAYIAALVGVGFLSAWLVNVRMPYVLAESHWHDYMRLATEILPEEERSDVEIFREKMLSLTAAEKANPNHARTQLRLGMSYLNLFQIMQMKTENAMSLAQFREAAISSGFESKEQLREWMERATGPHLKYLDYSIKHTRRALNLCPLQGQAYLYMSELAFLEMSGADERDDFIAQALTVRPYHPRILFEAGRGALIAGNTEKAIELWAVAFERSKPYRDRIIQMLSPNVTAQFFLEYFDPDWEALYVIGNHFRGLKRQGALFTILNAHAEESMRLAEGEMYDSETAIQYMMAAYRDYHEMDDQIHVRSTLEAAIARDQNAYFPREAYGKWLYEKQLFAESAKHLMWCAQRKPSDKKITTFAEYVRKRSLVELSQQPMNGSHMMAADGDEPEVSL